MQTVSERELRITRCVTCDQPLPTLIVGGRDPAREWECRRCGATYLATLASSSPHALRSCVKPLHYFPVHRQAATTLQATDLQRELRRHPRRPLMMSVPAMQLDDDLFPVGEDFTVISRNLSASGISLVHTRPLEGKLAILIELPEVGHVQLLLDIVRSKQIGSLYEMGGEFFDRR
jgi:hypothetical protein